MASRDRAYAPVRRKPLMIALLVFCVAALLATSPELRDPVERCNSAAPAPGALQQRAFTGTYDAGSLKCGGAPFDCDRRDY